MVKYSVFGPLWVVVDCLYSVMFLSKKDAVLQDSDQAALWDYFFPPQKWNLNPNFQKKLLLAKISVESLLWVNLKWHVNMGGIKKSF